ncbi:hypothetical protein L798_01976 [Zootermopsis nevadensis]|uniref:Uncharacterized protein n=1 Tax=Zootermopsis nevadensis TaxID=136037 RepID=A0A067QHX3_ZOONE|nr:hypothetical protein L798_01976 [Zootermopsis nevadensis]
MRDEQRAGGVAMYEKHGATTMATPHLLMKLPKEDGADYRIAEAEKSGDICASECMVNGEKVFVVTLYISNNTPIDDCKRFVFSHLGTFPPKFTEMFSIMATEDRNTMPIILAGAFNIDLKYENQSFVNVVLLDQNLVQIWCLH